MTKGNKKIQMELKETKNNRDGFVELELYVKKEKVGKIQQEDGQPVSVITSSGKEFKTRSVDEAINELIMEYNLHYM